MPVASGFMVCQTEGHPPATSKFSVVAVDTIELQGPEGIVKKLLPTLSLLKWGKQQNTAVEATQNE
jgi:hypothetical protein